MEISALQQLGCTAMKKEQRQKVRWLFVGGICCLPWVFSILQWELVLRFQVPVISSMLPTLASMVRWFTVAWQRRDMPLSLVAEFQGIHPNFKIVMMRQSVLNSGRIKDPDQTSPPTFCVDCWLFRHEIFSWNPRGSAALLDGCPGIWVQPPQDD